MVFDYLPKSFDRESIVLGERSDNYSRNRFALNGTGNRSSPAKPSPVPAPAGGIRVGRIVRLLRSSESEGDESEISPFTGGC